MHQQKKNHCSPDDICVFMVLQVVEDTMHIGAETAGTLKAQVNLRLDLVFSYFILSSNFVDMNVHRLFHHAFIISRTCMFQNTDGGFQCRLSN